MLEEQDDTILARWLEGKLTPQEHTAFENSEEFQDYRRIADGMKRFLKPEYDKESLKSKLFIAKEKISNKKVVALKPWYFWAAASILVLLGIGFYFNDVDYIASSGEQLAITLPDGSKINLNAGSHLKRNRFLWSWDRNMTLVEGEGFFEVEKGEELFVVKTDVGSVKVLGTKFNLRTRKEVFALSCYEGKVMFEEAGINERTVLTQGQEIVKYKSEFIKDNFSESRPTWMDGTSVFKNVPLKQVMDELEVQFGITFEHNLVNTSQNFTGSFIHSNLETALKTVFLPMGIEYNLAKDGKTMVLKVSE